MTDPSYLELAGREGAAPIKAWVRGVELDASAELQLQKTAMLPFVGPHLAVMPDVHTGIGATVGSVIPTRGAIIPAAVGVDIGCGMIARRTTLTADQLPDGLAKLRSLLEEAVPAGRADHTSRKRGIPDEVGNTWRDELEPGWRSIKDKHRKLGKGTSAEQLGTLGGGNHFVELCLDEAQRVWVMLHSGSRGIGNRTGTYFIELAREEMQRLDKHLPDRDLAYFSEGSALFSDYVEAVGWAQEYARLNRELMMDAVLTTMKRSKLFPRFTAAGTTGDDDDETASAVNCHHNYVAKETHFGDDLWITRKGAVRAGLGELGIIPGSMGVKSYIVRGKGNPESFCSCSHGAGRRMSRTEAKQRFTLADHRKATEGVECRKDKDVIDETPGAYKDIDAVMAAQSDLVEVVHTLKQVLCIKG